MRTVQQLNDRLAAPQQWRARGDQLFLLVADVKEMYTGMLHAVCVAAVQFIVDRCSKQLRSPYISVSKSRHGPVFAGKSKSADMVVFPLSELVKVVQFELSNMFFTVGQDILLQQVVGAAMGGFTSPAVAQAVACVAEYTNMTRFVTSGYLAASRFMDDILVIINLTVLSRSWQYHVGHVLHALFSCYQPAGLQLELERAGLIVTVLQSVVSVATQQLHAYFWNKNADFQRTGTQKVRRFIPCAEGCVSRAQQRCAISGMLHRVAASTLLESLPLLQPVLAQLRLELHHLGYHSSLFDQAVRSFVHTQQYSSSHAAWHALWRKLQAQCGSDGTVG